MSSRFRQPLLGSFEENVLNNRLEPIRTVEGYRAEVRASGAKFQSQPLISLVQVSIFSVDHNFPYLGQVYIGHRGYRIPKKGTLQVTLFNPLDKVERLFLLIYDLNDMPPNSQTFLRQRTLLIPVENTYTDSSAKLLTLTSDNNGFIEKKASQIRYILQLNIVSSQSGRIYLNKDLRIFVSKKLDLEAALQLTNGELSYELRSFNEMPSNPRYFQR